jgi:hypothetical protein
MREALLALGRGDQDAGGAAAATIGALVRRGLAVRKRPMYPGSTGSWLSLTPEGYQALIDFDGPANPSLDELLAESEDGCSGWCRPPENLCGWCSRQALIAERDRLRAALEEIASLPARYFPNAVEIAKSALAPADDRAEPEDAP